ncbi:MAG TPA: hypothetical protein VJ785_04485 [Anaerolineales bacterium]|nr:hypothetical protein [Anaerolineales bacterium]
MCCAFTLLVLLGPRITGAVWWIARPTLWNSAFSSFLWPVLGLIFVPWTTLFYMFVFPGGVTGFEWFWIVVGLLVDIGSYSGGVYGNRDQLPMYKSPTPPV